MSQIENVQQAALACAAAGSAACTALSLAADVAMQVFGVPLPVVLAALTGACGARVFLPPQPFWRAFWGSTFWTLAGAFTAQLALWVASWWLGKEPPSGALAGVSLFAAAFGQRVAPIVWNQGGEALKRKFDGLFRNGG